MASQVTIRPLEPFGAEVELDLRENLSPEQVEALRAAFNKHHILVFRRQDLSYDQQAAFLSNFGRLIPPESEYRTISNVAEGGGLGKVELMFHSDGSFLPNPYLGISLHALEVDEGNTSTLFQDNTRAYHRLTDEMKERLAPLKVRNVWAVKSDERNVFDPKLPHYDHPLINLNPRSGEPILYISPLHTTELVGIPHDEGQRLLEELIAEARRDNTYEHKWYLGDLVMWDNFALVHARGRLSDTPRTLQRVVLGDKPGAEQIKNYDAVWAQHFAQTQEYAA